MMVVLYAFHPFASTLCVVVLALSFLATGFGYRHDLSPDGFRQGGQTAGQVGYVGGQARRVRNRRGRAGIGGKCATFCAAFTGRIL